MKKKPKDTKLLSINPIEPWPTHAKHTERSIFEMSWTDNPYLEKNNRGAYSKHKVYIRYGYPTPPAGRKEKDDEMKGSDYIGPQQVTITNDMVGKTVAIFKGLEIKTITDKLKPGQIKFHNWLLSIGGLSEIHIEQKDGSIKIIDYELDNIL